ncbi:MAG: hypothetical protein JRM89_03980 [Nitrososphaerota archaeon]|nr:hypothetical protein [Nitrososphaerota archaeon]MDG7015133.1 hypothetical protein [Nitrososphaerota archaeon]
MSERADKEEPKESFIPAATVITPNGIAEEVWDRLSKPRFALKRFGVEGVEYVERIETEEVSEEGKPVVYVPADGPALRKGLVLVPREPTEGTFEEAFEKGRTLAHEVYDTSNGHAAEFDFLVAVAQASWFLDRFIPDPSLSIAGMGHFAPIISLRGPSGHGKNRALSALRLNSYRPFYDQSTKRIPSLFRPLDLWRGTLCLDECDLGKSDEASDVVHYLNCRAYGTPISRQNPDAPTQSQAFHNFGLTIDTQRRPWQDDALENRTLPYNCERSQKDLATTELDDWLSRGLELQDRLLYLRLTNWENVRIDKAARLPTIRDHRLTASVLPVLALRKLAPRMVSNLEGILGILARRRQEVRAASSDGIIVNHLWEKLDGGLIGAWNGRLYVGAEKTKDEKSEEETVLPLQTSEMAEALRWRSSDIRRVISSLQVTPDDAPRHTVRFGTRVTRPIFFSPEKLEVLLADFVVDYAAGTLRKRLAESGIVTDVTLVTDYSPVSPPAEGAPPTGPGSVTSVTTVTDSKEAPA